MNQPFFKTVQNSIKHWYIPLIVGIIFIIIGFYTLFSPIASYLTLATLFSVSFLVSGLSELYFSIANRKEIDNLGWLMASSIITTLMGVLLIIHPKISLTILPFYVGFLVLFRSVNALSTALDLKNYGILDWGNLMLVGILGLLFSFILIWNPVFAGMTIVFWTGSVLIFTGIFSIYLSLKFKKLKDFPNKISDELKARYEAIKAEIKEELKK